MFKVISSIILLLLILPACSPRDEVVGDGDNRNQGIDLASGQIVTIDKDGQRSETCGPEGKAKDWDSIRIFNELNMIFAKAEKNQLSIFVNKKGRSCVRIGSKLELQTQATPDSGSPKGIGVFVQATKVLIMNTDDLIANTALMTEFSQGMGLSVGELEKYLKDRYDKQVNVTYFKPFGEVVTDDGATDSGDTMTPPVDNSFTVLKSPADDGKTLSECSDPLWTSMQVKKWFKDEYKDVIFKSINDKSIKVLVVAGKNCLPVGAVAHFVKADEAGKYTVPVGGEFIVTSIIEMGMDRLKNDPLLLDYVAEDMAMTTEMFSDFLNNINNEKVNMTFFQWLNDQSAGGQ